MTDDRKPEDRRQADLSLPSSAVCRLCLLLALFITTCGELPETMDNPDTDYGYISALIIWPENRHQKTGTYHDVLYASMPSTVTTVTMTLSGSGITSMSKDFDASLGQGTISGVPVGERTLTIEGKDSNGSVLYQGSSSVSVVANQNTEITVTMVYQGAGAKWNSAIWDQDVWGE